ncbi:hypothetical protein HGM15179_002202, partial [Zosterops borbonicus]
ESKQPKGDFKLSSLAKVHWELAQCHKCTCAHRGNPNWDMDAKAKSTPPSETVAVTG